MKKILFIPLLVLATLTAQAQNPSDLNKDGDVNVGDVTALVNMILGKAETTSNADLNKDGDAYYLDFSSGNAHWDGGNRSYGRSVRPVAE